MHHRKSGGDGKHGRNKAKCSRYRAESKREKARARKRARHLKKNPNDTRSG